MADRLAATRNLSNVTRHLGAISYTCLSKLWRSHRERVVISSLQMQAFLAQMSSTPRKVIRTLAKVRPRCSLLTPRLLDPTGEPTEPKLAILQVNLIGVMYTLKLAMHYFRVQPEAPGRDRCFIFKGSIAGLLDQPGTWQYCAAKFGLRGAMRSARRTSWQEGIRVNYVAPW